MTSFVHAQHPTVHQGVERFTAAFEVIGQARKGFTGTKAIATLLLAAVVSAMLVAANQLIDTWTDGHLLAAWVALWAVAFAALALFADTARQMASRTVRGWQAWRQEAAQQRADAQLWQHALSDERLMRDLQMAQDRAESEADAVVASTGVQAREKASVSFRIASRQLPLKRVRYYY